MNVKTSTRVVKCH